jgi:hypothetical protein
LALARFAFVLAFFAFAFGRVRLAFFLAFGRAAFFRLRTVTRFGFGAVMLDSPSIGEGDGAGGRLGTDGMIGSIMPGPVQPLSEKSVCWRIGTFLRWWSVGVAYSLRRQSGDASEPASSVAARDPTPARGDKLA